METLARHFSQVARRVHNLLLDFTVAVSLCDVMRCVVCSSSATVGIILPKSNVDHQCAWTFHEHLFLSHSGPRGLRARAETRRPVSGLTLQLFSSSLSPLRSPTSRPGSPFNCSHCSGPITCAKGPRKLQRKSQLKSPEPSIEQFC